VGDNYAWTITIEPLSNAYLELNELSGTYHSGLMLAWTAPCLQGPILSRYDFQWPKLDGLPLVVSMQTPSPVRVGSLLPLQFNIYNLGSSPRHFDLTLPPALCLGSEHPYWVDDISFRPQHNKAASTATPPADSPRQPIPLPDPERIGRLETTQPAGPVMIGNQRHSILSQSSAPGVEHNTASVHPEALQNEGPTPRPHDGPAVMRSVRSLSALRPTHPPLLLP
jgi:hypothetical protein